MIDTYYGMLVRDPFSEIPKTPSRSKSLYFKDEAWMKYHKCPLCENYVLKEPERIKVPRGSAGTHRINMWNEALWVICWDKKASPCIKCVSDLTRYFIIDQNRSVCSRRRLIFMPNPDEFKKRRDEEYLPQQVKDWWYSLSESQKSFWIKRAEMERKNLVGRSK